MTAALFIGYGLEAAQVHPGVFHRLRHFAEPRADAHRFDDQLLDLVLEQALAIAGARLRRLRHHGSHARLRHQPALLDQVLNDLVRGVWMDLEVEREGAYGGEGFPGLQLAGQDGFDGGEADLVEDRLAGIELELEWD